MLHPPLDEKIIRKILTQGLNWNLREIKWWITIYNLQFLISFVLFAYRVSDKSCSFSLSFKCHLFMNIREKKIEKLWNNIQYQYLSKVLFWLIRMLFPILFLRVNFHFFTMGPYTARSLIVRVCASCIIWRHGYSSPL